MKTLDKLRAQLAELEATRPEMPRDLPPDHPRFVAFRNALQAFVDRKQLLQAQISAALCPIEFGKRTERPLAALRPAPMRLRQ